MVGVAKREIPLSSSRYREADQVTMVAPITANDAFLNAEMDLGLNMLRQSPTTEQLVVSPISIIFALAMVQAGARGKTRTQINQVISSGATDDGIINYYSSLSKDISISNEKVETRIANAFFLNKEFSIEKQYADTITGNYSAKVEALDFDNAKQTAQKIDEFVNDATVGRIKDIVEESTVRGANSLIINAIYFHGKWQHEFDKFDSRNYPFHSSAVKQRKIKFMNEEGKKRYYAEDEDMQVLSLPYQDASYAFNILLPKKKFGLEELRKKLNGTTIKRVLSQLESTMLGEISIPKMKIETDYKLKEALMAIGVTEMFSDAADLTGITRSRPLKVSSAAHRALIEVDEGGTTAAAATSVRFILTSGSIYPTNFIADHPFIFILTKNHNPLFMGQFV
ncbi:hypothetical protein RB195_015722 [Necator americanus]|uniref:Serpin domain-containing protein n=2 Tax=Necator americanus TaxID=51031 RepID=A0ABR1E5W0_NECAM